jgi:hypothetical protein
MADQAGMNLDDFVSQTLLAIVGGVLKAQADETCGAHIGRSVEGASTITVDYQGNVVTLVSFDLATTVEDKSGTSGGAGIKVIPMLRLQADAKSEKAASAVSRIAFSVSISLPKPAAQRAEDKASADRVDSALRGF